MCQLKQQTKQKSTLSPNMQNQMLQIKRDTAQAKKSSMALKTWLLTVSFFFPTLYSFIFFQMRQSLLLFSFFLCSRNYLVRSSSLKCSGGSSNYLYSSSISLGFLTGWDLSYNYLSSSSLSLSSSLCQLQEGGFRLTSYDYLADPYYESKAELSLCARAGACGVGRRRSKIGALQKICWISRWGELLVCCSVRQSLRAAIVFFFLPLSAGARLKKGSSCYTQEQLSELTEDTRSLSSWWNSDMLSLSLQEIISITTGLFFSLLRVFMPEINYLWRYVQIQFIQNTIAPQQDY